MIVTPLDSAVLDSKEQYIFYHKMVDFVFKELIVAFQHHNLYSEQEMTIFKQYCDLFLYSINAMRIKYMYDEFRYLYNDLELRKNYLKKLTGVEQLKEEFLDTLLRKKEPVKRRQLFQAASIVYYTSVEQQFIFNRFVQGKIFDVKEGENGEFLISWGFYDVSHNRPFICYMYFDYDGKDPLKEKNKIYEVLKNVADRKMNLDTMAYAIDRKLTNVFPRHIKRIDLGPLHNVFAKDENEITHTILEGIGKKTIPLESYAMTIGIDEVFSGSEFIEGSFFNKQTLQKWSKVIHQTYLFAPHRVIQLLYSKAPDVLNKLVKAPFQMSSFNK